MSATLAKREAARRRVVGFIQTRTGRVSEYRRASRSNGFVYAVLNPKKDLWKLWEGLYARRAAVHANRRGIKPLPQPIKARAKIESVPRAGNLAPVRPCLCATSATYASDARSRRRSCRQVACWRP